MPVSHIWNFDLEEHKLLYLFYVCVIVDPSSACWSVSSLPGVVPVIFVSLTLGNMNYVILGVNLIFQKLESSLSCSTFSRKLKISEIGDQNIQFTIAGKYLKKAAGNCYSQFPDTK